MLRTIIIHLYILFIHLHYSLLVYSYLDVSKVGMAQRSRMPRVSYVIWRFVIVVAMFPVWSCQHYYYLDRHLGSSELLQSGRWLKHRWTCSIYFELGVVFRRGQCYYISVCSTWRSLPIDHYGLMHTGNNRQLHTFLSNLGIIVHAIVKIVLGLASYNFDYCLVQLFPNWTRMRVITYTNKQASPSVKLKFGIAFRFNHLGYQLRCVYRTGTGISVFKLRVPVPVFKGLDFNDTGSSIKTLVLGGLAGDK